jgi:hypothetical protein
MLISNQRNFCAYVSGGHVAEVTLEHKDRARERERHVSSVLWHYISDRYNKDVAGKSRKLAPAMYRSSDGITIKEKRHKSHSLPNEQIESTNELPSTLCAM